ncbi:hypothetical protein ACHAWF_007697 [Thalassiosira exigua]
MPEAKSRRRRPAAAASSAQNDGEAAPMPAATTLQRFVAGLAAQIPPSKLRAVAPSSQSDGDALRLFLERSTEALPMGSRVRVALGGDFELALGMLGEAIAERIALEDGGRGKRRDGGERTKTGEDEQQHPIMVFSEAQYRLAQECLVSRNDKRMRQLLLCTDHAAPEDLAKELSPSSLPTFQNALEMCGDRDEYEDIVNGFTNALLSSDDDNQSSFLPPVHQFLTCLATRELPAGTSLAVGRLVGMYAQLALKGDITQSVSYLLTKTILVVFLSFDSIDSMDSHRAAVPHAAEFVRGYLRGIQLSKDCSPVLVADATLCLTRALPSALGDGMPTFTEVKHPCSRNDKLAYGKSHLRIWKEWSEKIIAAQGGSFHDEEKSMEDGGIEKLTTEELKQGEQPVSSFKRRKKNKSKRKRRLITHEKNQSNDAEAMENTTEEVDRKKTRSTRKRRLRTQEKTESKDAEVDKPNKDVSKDTVQRNRKGLSPRNDKGAQSSGKESDVDVADPKPKPDLKSKRLRRGTDASDPADSLKTKAKVPSKRTKRASKEASNATEELDKTMPKKRKGSSTRDDKSGPPSGKESGVDVSSAKPKASRTSKQLRGASNASDLFDSSKTRAKVPSKARKSTPANSSRRSARLGDSSAK